MTDDKVISIATRKPWHEELAEKRRQRRSEGQRRRRDRGEASKEFRETTLESLDKIRALYAAGKLEGLVIIGRCPESKNFLTDVVFHETLIPLSDMFAWAGVIGALEMEIKENALMAPAIQLDGTTVDPNLEMMESLFSEGEYE